MPSLPTQMQALIHDIKTNTTSIKTTPLPIPSPSEYLLHVHATTFTKGELTWLTPNSSIIPGVEFCATIVETPDAGKFQLGDRVYGRIPWPKDGAAREYIVATETELALAPKNLKPTQTAAVPLQTLTAWQALFVHGGISSPTNHIMMKGRLSARKRVLIAGASGSVGMWAVQFAKLVGAEVVATGGKDSLEMLRSLGADDILDYKTTSVAAWVAEDETARAVDLAIDCVGRDTTDEVWAATKAGGKVVSIVPTAELLADMFKTDNWAISMRPKEGLNVRDGVEGLTFVMKPSGEMLDQITPLVEEGKGIPVIDSVWAFGDWDEAFRKSQSGKLRGKVVLKVEG